MKKNLLTLMAVGVCLSAVAQNKAVVQQPNANNVATKTTKQTVMKDEAAPFKKPTSNVKAVAQKGGGYLPGIFATTEAVVGQTDYDLQTNSSPFPRIKRNSDGTISCGWTMIPDGGASAQRGTGYNYFDGSNWGPAPTARIEPTSRTGFVNLLVTASGQEASFGHSSTATCVLYTNRPAKGTGPWTENNVLANGGTNSDTWARACTDGSNIHTIVNTNDGNNVLVYSRSTDDGATWNPIRATIPGCDVTDYPYGGVGGDNYYIAAKGNTVAFVLGDVTTDLALFKSTDNGTTWTKSYLTTNFTGGSYNPDGNISDIDGDQVADTVLVTGGDIHVMIDNNGTVHVAWGLMRMLDDDATAGVTTVSVFLGTNGIAYWNETMTGPVLSGAQAMDWNNNGGIDTPVDPDPNWADPNELRWGRYGNMGIACHPSMGMDANGVLYMTFMALNENSDTTIYYKTHYQPYIISSADGGNTWTEPYNIITNAGIQDSALWEGAFPNMDPNVGSNVYVIYQRDYAPGHSLAGAGTVDEANNNPALQTNDIVVATVPTSELAGLFEHTPATASFTVSQNSPNPFNGMSHYTINLKSASEITVDIMNAIGQTVKSEKYEKKAAGTHVMTLDASTLTSGVYYYTVKAGNESVTNKFIVK